MNIFLRLAFIVFFVQDQCYPQTVKRCHGIQKALSEIAQSLAERSHMLTIGVDKFSSGPTDTLAATIPHAVLAFRIRIDPELDSSAIISFKS